MNKRKAPPERQGFLVELPGEGMHDTIENAQAIAAHESPRTTKLYDRTSDEITLDEVERIAIQLAGCVSLSLLSTVINFLGVSIVGFVNHRLQRRGSWRVCIPLRVAAFAVVFQPFWKTGV